MNQLDSFITDLKTAGIPIGITEEIDCHKSLLLIDWSNEPIFYSALRCTLLKETALLAIFNQIYSQHFSQQYGSPPASDDGDTLNDSNHSQVFGIGSSGKGMSILPTPRLDLEEDAAPPPVKVPTPKSKNPLTHSFYEATYMSTPEELARMEQLIPLLGKRMAAKMVIKKKRNIAGTIDLRKTMRMSLNTGGVPIDLGINKKQKEKPVIFALCDVSWSCLQYSYFSLAIIYSLEKFFHMVRSFAFIGVTDEVTDIIKHEPYEKLRTQVLAEANVSGKSGYTDYGGSLASFLVKYGDQLTSRSYVLIFGDGRTNWYSPRTELLNEIRNRVKKVYWFNPDLKSEWGDGDSSMLAYQKHCSKCFECSNLEQLAAAICEIS